MIRPGATGVVTVFGNFCGSFWLPFAYSIADRKSKLISENNYFDNNSAFSANKNETIKFTLYSLNY